MERKHHIYSLFLAGALSFISFYALGADGDPLPHGTKVNITATIVAPPPCVINNNNKIEIDFGVVGINRIDGVNYRKKIEYQLSCDGVDEARQLVMKISGMAANFDARMLDTTTRDLAIKFEQESQQMDLNSAVRFNLGQPPSLYAVLVKNSVGTLIEGEFTSSATLEVSYQ